MDPSLRAHWIRLIAATGAVLAGAFVLPHVMRPPDLVENRVLAPPPAWPQDAAGLEPFRKGVDAYVADHFPPRAQLIGLLNQLRLKLGVSGSAMVVVGREGWLFGGDNSHLSQTRGEPPLPDDEIRSWLTAVAGRTEALRAEGRGYAVLIPPVKEAIYPEMAPAWYRLNPDRRAVVFSELAAAARVGDVTYPHAVLAEQARWGTRVFDRYDTHWTGVGAYHGYVALMRTLQRQGLTEAARPISDFTEQFGLPEGQHPRNLALMLGVASFVTVRYPQFEDAAALPRLKTTYLTDRQEWTAPRVIDTGQTGKPVLFMTMDSFSNAFLPFLYGHFSRIVTTHQQDGVWRRDMIDRFQPDFVVIELLENGAGAVAAGGAPAPSRQALARIDQVMRDPKAYRERRAVITDSAGRLDGTARADVIEGGDGPEEIQGYKGADTITGLGGADVIRGGRDNDSIDGGAGADWISSGRGDDRMRGGPGADVFELASGSGVDEILDFNAAEHDRIEGAPKLAYTVRQVGPDTVIEVEGGRLILRGVALAGLPDGWIRRP